MQLNTKIKGLEEGASKPMSWARNFLTSLTKNIFTVIFLFWPEKGSIGKFPTDFLNKQPRNTGFISEIF